MQTVTTAHISVSFALYWSIPRIKSNLIRPHCLYRGRSLKHLLLLLLELVPPPTTQSIMANQVSLMSYLQHGPTALPRGMQQAGSVSRIRQIRFRFMLRFDTKMS